MNYTCRQVKELLDTYLDNMTNELQNEAIEKHLQECVECRTELDFLKSIIELESNFPAIDVSDDFYTNLHQKLIIERNKTTRNTLGKIMLKSAALLSAAAVITISVVSFGSIKDKTIDESDFTDAPIVASETLYTIEKRTTEDTAPVTEEPSASETKKTEAKKETKKETKQRQESSLLQRLLGDNQKPKTSEESTESKQKAATNDAVSAFTVPQKTATPTQAPAIKTDVPATVVPTKAPQKVNVPEKVKVIAIVTAKDGDRALAQQMFTGCSVEDGAYVLSAAQYQSVLGKLDEMGASVAFARENKTSRYAELTANLQNGVGDAASIKKELSAIDNEISKKYIILN